MVAYHDNRKQDRAPDLSFSLSYCETSDKKHKRDFESSFGGRPSLSECGAVSSWRGFAVTVQGENGVECGFCTLGYLCVLFERDVYSDHFPILKCGYLSCATV